MLTSGNEFICKDFFLHTENNQFGIVATSTVPDQDAPVSEGAIQGVPSVEKITFSLVRLSDGKVMDKRIFRNDFIHLSHNMGVFLYDDLLSIMSIRYQTIHILQIREAGAFVDVRAIGTYCREDDELILNSQAQRVQRLKRFYYHFQHYVDLVMWKVQFLDRHHLLIKFGSVDGGTSRTSDYQTAFFAVYNIETTQLLAFYENSSRELFFLLEQYCDQFRAPSQYPLYMKFISSYNNNIHAREQLRKQRDACLENRAGSYSQFMKKILACVPYSSQSQSPSPYFDQSLFHFDEKLISSTDRNRQCLEHPIKFISRRYPNTLKFKINPGLEAGAIDGRTKRLESFIFHPILPFAISIQQAFMQPSIVNIHLRR